MSTIYSNKELRFFRLTKGVVDYSTEALRTVFQQEWNYLYPATPWRNDRANGQQLLAEERARGSRLYDPVYSVEYKSIKDNLDTGDVQEWDVTTLVFALKYSHALRGSRSSRRGRIIGNALYQIKEVRNYVIAHAKRTSISRSSFERHINTLLRAVEDLLTKSHSLVKKLEQLENETEFQTEDLLRYKKLLKDDRSGLLSLEKDLERLESKMKNPNAPEIDYTSSVCIAGSDHKNSGNSEIILRLQTRVARIESQVDISPSKTRPDILYSNKYIEMINKSNFLSYNFFWEELKTYLDRFSSDVNIDMQLYAGIQWAAALSHRSRKREALEVLSSLIPNALRASNGVVIHARIKIRKAYLLHDLGNDDDAMKEVDEAEQMLSLAECHEDNAEVNNAKANIILSRSQNNKLDQNQILHHLDKAIESCEKATVDKSNTIIQVMLRKALVHLGFYQHGILEDVQSSTVDTAENVINHIARQSKKLSKRSTIYYIYSQSLLAYRKGQINLAMKLEHKARRKSGKHHLSMEIQQLDLLKNLLRA